MSQLQQAARVFLIFSVVGCSELDRTVDRAVKSDISALVKEIRSSRSDEEQERLLAELDDRYVDGGRFYRLWLRVHEVQPFWDCWSETGYDPTQSNIPRDIQILAATDYGRSDINNGGFFQFYLNGTGVFAPEMIEFFERSGMDDAASVIRESMAVFGEKFPREHEARSRFLKGLWGASSERAEWDPFVQLDDRFYDVVNDEKYEGRANTWLREVCQVSKFADFPSRSKQ